MNAVKWECLGSYRHRQYTIWEGEISVTWNIFNVDDNRKVLQQLYR